MIKSGTDFRQFSKITLNFDKAAVEVIVKPVDVTSAFEEDETLKAQLDKYASESAKWLEMCNYRSVFQCQSL